MVEFGQCLRDFHSCALFSRLGQHAGDRPRPALRGVRREAEKLLRETEGNLCARLYRRAHDTIVMENCPVGLRATGTRVSRWAGAAMA